MGKELSDYLSKYFSSNISDIAIETVDNGFVVKCTLNFESYFSFKDRKFYLTYSFNKFKDDYKYFIKDNYQVYIGLFNNKNPEVIELGNRLLNLSKDRGLKPADVHLMGSEGKVLRCCLCSPHVLERYNFQVNNYKDKLSNLLNDLIFPYFYSQSFFEKYNTWPWENINHGRPGLIEEFLKEFPSNNKIILKDRILTYTRYKGKFREHRKCVCGSGRKFRNCHKEQMKLLKYIIKLYGNFDKINIQL